MPLTHAPRIAPLDAPYTPSVEAALSKWMPPGSQIEPLRLFRTLVVHEDLASRMRPLGAGILGSTATVPPSLREVVIHRTCALTGPPGGRGRSLSVLAGVPARCPIEGAPDAQIAGPSWRRPDGQYLRDAPAR